ncbi:hypothetical protein HDU96_009249 [Phlyctochytrium bullatum]|nr:hypothetical protein HDU96_009249 [Phlyctochytrium bullatum]
MVTAKRIDAMKASQRASYFEAEKPDPDAMETGPRRPSQPIQRSMSLDASAAAAVRAAAAKIQNSRSGAAAADRGRRILKVGLKQVLNDELDSPFSLAEFYIFLKKEHSEENIEFYEEIERYRQFVQDKLNWIPPPVSADASEPADPPPPPSPEAAAFLEELQQRLQKILEVYFQTGADKELNIPASVRKRVLAEVKEKKNFHPDVFNAAVDNVCTMMRLSSFPNFYKKAMQEIKKKDAKIMQV